jgi:hypothetical protein
MALRLVQVNFKAQDDASLGKFWADALGWGLYSEAPGVTNVEPARARWPDVSVGIDVVSVPDPATVKYRAHLELATTSATHHAGLVAHLLAVGGTLAAHGFDTDSTAMNDPDGNPFFVRGPRSTRQHTGPIAAIVIACADPAALASFWATAIDWNVDEASADRIHLRSPAGVGPSLEFARMPDPDASPTRMHLDLRPYPGDDQSVEVARLRGLGAIDVDLGQGDVSWAVLADPEGNDFCVLASG